MQGQGLLRAWLVLWLAQYSLQGGTNVGAGLGVGRAKAGGAGLPLGALGGRGFGTKPAKIAGRYPGTLMGMGAYRGVLGRPMRPGYGALGAYGGYGPGLGLGTGLGMKLPRGYGTNGYGYRGQPLGTYGGLGTYPGAGLGLGGVAGAGPVHSNGQATKAAKAGYGVGAAGYPGVGLANGYGAGYNDYNLGANGYGAGLGLPTVLADGTGLAAKSGKGAGVGARSFSSPALSLGALGALGANGKSGQYGDAGVGRVAGTSQLPFGGEPVVPAGLGAEVTADSLGEGPVSYVGQPFQPTGLGHDDNLGGLAAGLGLDPVASKFGGGAYLGAGVPPAGYNGQLANGQGPYVAKSAKFELNEFLDN